jgi:glycolate oxidase
MLSLRAPVERVSPALADRARSLLHRALGPSKVLTSEDECAPFLRDESEAIGVVPDVVVLAETTEDIATTLRIASEIGAPVTPRSGGSGKTGGAVAVAGGIVLVTRGMTGVKEIDRADLLAVVEPGVILGDFQAQVEREGLFFPPDPSSAGYSCLGGNVAENAGGPRAFKYGVTGQYVLGLDAYLMSGTRVRAGRRTVKGVTGYDLTSLFVGSEGTLGVFSEITLRLLRAPGQVITLMALFAEVRHAGLAVGQMVAAGLVPRCMELLDATTLDAVRRRGLPIDAAAGAMLLLEVDGDPAACDREAQRVGDACAAAGATSVLVAQDAAQRDRLWAARREMSPSIRQLTRHKLSEDVVVPRSRVADLLDEVARIGETHRVRTLGYGHAGDGNLHVNFLWNDDDEVPRVEAAIEALFRAVVAMRGTLSGEHGIGVLKAPYLRLEQDEATIEAQQAIKRSLDPRGLLNPGKIFWPRSHGGC